MTLSVAALVLTLAQAQADAPGPAPVRVQVTGHTFDPAGLALRGVTVFAMDQVTKAIVARTQSDAHGAFALTVDQRPHVFGAVADNAELVGFEPLGQRTMRFILALRGKMNEAASALQLVVGARVPGAPADPRRVAGQVRFHGNEALEGVRIVLFDSDTRTVAARTHTDATGRFATVVPAGRYRVHVLSPGLFVQKISAPAPEQIDVRMTILAQPETVFIGTPRNTIGDPHYPGPEERAAITFRGGELNHNPTVTPFLAGFRNEILTYQREIGHDREFQRMVAGMRDGFSGTSYRDRGALIGGLDMAAAQPQVYLARGWHASPSQTHAIVLDRDIHLERRAEAWAQLRVWRMRTEASALAILALVTSRDAMPDTRVALVADAAGLPFPGVRVPLTRALADPDARVRERAAVALGPHRSDAAVRAALERARGDADATVRRAATDALGS